MVSSTYRYWHLFFSTLTHTIFLYYHCGEICIYRRCSDSVQYKGMGGVRRNPIPRHGNFVNIFLKIDDKAQHYLVSAFFHLTNRETNRELNVISEAQTNISCAEPKYLDLKLHRTLTFRRHFDYSVSSI